MTPPDSALARAVRITFHDSSELGLDIPGNRNAKHYFPVTGKATRVISPDEGIERRDSTARLDTMTGMIECDTQPGGRP